MQVCSAQWFWLRLSKQQLHGLFSPDHFFFCYGAVLCMVTLGAWVVSTGNHWLKPKQGKKIKTKTGQVRIWGASFSFDIVLLPRQSLHAFFCLSHIYVIALHSCFTPLTGKGAVWRQWLYYTGAQDIFVGWMTNEWRNGLYNTWLKELVWRGESPFLGSPIALVPTELCVLLQLGGKSRLCPSSHALGLHCTTDPPKAKKHMCVFNCWLIFLSILKISDIRLDSHPSRTPAEPEESIPCCRALLFSLRIVTPLSPETKIHHSPSIHLFQLLQRLSVNKKHIDLLKFHLNTMK